MALQEQNVAISFAGGIDTKTDFKQVMPNEFLILENAIYKTLKQIRKRNGYQKLSNSVRSSGFTYLFNKIPSSISNGAFVSTLSEELLMGDGFNLFSYSTSDTKWTYKGRLENCSTSELSIVQNQYNNVMSDSCINTTSGLSLYAWEEWTANPRTNGVLDGVRVSLRDNNTQQELLGKDISFSATTSRPKCVAVGANVFVVYYDSSISGLKATLVTGTLPWVTTTIISNINTTNPNYDIGVNGSTVYVAYNGTGGTVKVASFNSSFSPIANISKAETAPNGVGLFFDTSNNVWVAYNNGSATKAFIVNAALGATVLAPTVVDSTALSTNVLNVTGSYDGTQGIILWDQPGLPVIGQTTGFTNTGGFTQPAVGSSVLVTFSGDVSANLNQVVYLGGAGHYYVSGVLAGSGGTNVGLTNLGYPGDMAPGSAVGAGGTLFPTSGYQNARINYNTLSVGGSVGTAALYLNSAALASKAFTVSGIIHALTTHDALIQPTYFLTSLYNLIAPSAIANIVAKVDYLLGGGVPRTSNLPAINIDSSNNYNVAIPKVVFTLRTTENNTQVGINYCGVVQETFNFSPTEINSIEIGSTLNVGSGTISSYDGQSVTEQNFFLYPENITGSYTAASGDLGSGKYGYVVLYQWIDAQGQINRSFASPVLSITTPASGGSITLTIPTLRITGKSNVTIAIYRTQVNGSTYFRLDPQYNSYPINNSILNNSITFTDYTSDNNITGNEQLYTESEVGNSSPPASKFVSSYKNRMLVVPSDTPTSFWYSKQVVPGSPVEFSPLFFENVGGTGGPQTAAPVQMDDKLIIFKANSLYYMYGSGPSPSGANNDFTDPTLLASDVGCIDPNSVVLMPYGLMFKSNKGIYLLDRSLAVSYIGDKVEAYNQYNVISGELVTGQNQVRYIISNGTALVYDYYVKKWSVFTNHSAVSATVWQGTYSYLSGSGYVYIETPGVFTDDGSFIKLKARTSWLSLAGIQGYQRIYKALILGDYVGPHDLIVSIAYEFNSTFTQVDTITPQPILGNPPVYQWRINMAQQKCQTIQLQVEDNQSASFNEGLALSDISLEVGVKKGLNKLGATKSFG